MEDKNQVAITQDGLEAAAEETQNQEALETGAEAEADAQPENLEIPEKFVGKSPLEIIQAYNNAEKQLSKVSSERAEERKKREETEKRLQELEARINSVSQQPSQQREDSSPEMDPFEEYEKQFDKDPKEAIKSLVGKTRQQIKAERELAQREVERQLAAEYYNSQKRDNPEYAKLEPTMLAIAKEYGDLVDERRSNSVKALKLLYLAAKGAKVDDFVAEATSKAKKETTSLKEEKRAAFSESSNSKGSKNVNFADLPVDQMEKLLGIDHK